jgi:hypothetical protein
MRIDGFREPSVAFAVCKDGGLVMQSALSFARRMALNAYRATRRISRQIIRRSRYRQLGWI